MTLDETLLLSFRLLFVQREASQAHPRDPFSLQTCLPSMYLNSDAPELQSYLEAVYAHI